jgi:hypothetical protein
MLRRLVTEVSGSETLAVPPVNFASNILGYNKSFGSEIFQRTTKNIYGTISI